MTPFRDTVGSPTKGATTQSGKGLSAAEWTSLLYAELRRLAGHYMQQERPNHTLQATALVHEVYLILANQQGIHWQNRNEFMAAAAHVMWRVLLDYSRKHHAARRGGSATKVYLEEAVIPGRSRPADVVALDEALTRLAKVDEQQARLVELRFFGGLSIEESAGVLEISPATVKRHWNVAKAWLARELVRGQECTGSFRFRAAANAFAEHPRVWRNFPGARSASFQGNRSYIPLACADTFPRR